MSRYDDWLARPYDRLDDDDTCEDCDGRGFFADDEDDRDNPCPRCKGKGWIGEPA